MDKLKDLIKNKKKIVILVAIIIILLIAVGIYFATAGTSDNKAPVKQTDEKTTIQDVSVEELKPLGKKGVITGIKDLKVEKETEVNLEDFIVFNQDYVKSVEVDDSKVDYNKKGEYKVIYTVTFDGNKLQELLKNENIEVTFDTDSNTIIIRVTTTVTIIDKETAKEEAEMNNAVISNETKEEIAEKNKETSTSNGSNTSSNTGNSGSSSSGGSSSQPSKPTHSHSWKNHTATMQVWIENWVDVPDYETQQVFDHYLYIFNYDGYQTTSISDVKAHSVELLKAGISDTNYSEVPQYTTQQVQVGSHKEDHGHYETQSYVDYQYCDCGERR